MTTQRYMHLSLGAAEAAIALLEAPPPHRGNAERGIGSASGDVVETAPGHVANLH